MKKPDFSKIKDILEKSNGSEKDFTFGGYSVFSGIIVLAIAVFVILGVEGISSKYTKFDFTSAKLYSISEETENIVKGLEKDVQVYFITQSGREDQVIQNILERYDDLSDKLTVTVKDPAVNPTFAEKYTSGNVSLNSVIVECGEKSRYIGYEEMYTTNYDYQNYSQTAEFNGEASITGAISYVSGDYLPKVYLLSGHGEAELSQNMTEAMKKSNVETALLSLLTAESVPEDAACVMINEPSADISQAEKEMLLKYTQNGGNLLVFTGYTGRVMPNLGGLMQNYGVTSENTMIFEGDNSMCLRNYNYYLVPEMLEHEITKPLIEENYSVLIPMAKPIRLTDSKPETATITEILKTSKEAYAKVNVQGGTEKSSGDVVDKYTVGVAVENETAAGNSHVVWITTGNLLKEQVNGLVSGGNQDLFLNALNWMCGREESIAIHPKTLTAEYLTVSSLASTVWSIIFVFIIPLSVICLGVYVWIRRKSR